MKRTIFAVGAIAAMLTGCAKTPETAEAAKELKQPEAAPAPPPPPKPEPVTLASGTRIKVRTTSTISTESAQAGERFSATVAEPVSVDGKVVIPAGADVTGTVASADEGGRVKGVASLSLRITSIEMNGNAVPLQTGLFVKNAPATKKKDALTVGIGAGIGAAVGAIAGGGKGAAIGAASGGGAGTGVVLATRGAPAVVAAESLITFRLTAPAEVNQ